MVQALTAWYGLMDLGKGEPGESALGELRFVSWAAADSGLLHRAGAAVAQSQILARVTGGLGLKGSSGAAGGRKSFGCTHAAHTHDTRIGNATHTQRTRVPADLTVRVTVAGKTVLVHSAAGGVGGFALQICRLFDMHAVAVVGSVGC